MLSGILRRTVEPIETEVQSRPSAAEFEMAYQARVAIDRIKFAIRHTEQFGRPCETMREASLQLLDALEVPLPPGTEGRRRRGHESRCCRKPFQTPGLANAAHWTLRFRNTDESYERSD